MAEFPALPLWTDAYIADTCDLTMEEHGAYLILLMLAWRRPRCALPADFDVLKRMVGGACAGLHGNRFNRVVPGILARFWALENGEFVQKRLRKERDFVEKSREKQRERSRKRWEKINENKAIANATATQMAMPPHPQPTPKIEERKKDHPSGGRKKPAAPASAGKPAATRGKQIPDDFALTPERAAVAERHGLNGSAEAEFEHFRAHHQAHGSVMKDWEKAWVTWCCNARKFKRGIGPPTQAKRSKVDDILEYYAEKMK